VRRRYVELVMWIFLLWVGLAYFTLPVGWRVLHHPALTDAPRITLTANGIHGDPLNIAIIGEKEDLIEMMLAADWYPADRTTLVSSFKIVADTIFHRSYETAPVSNLYLWDRKQDLAFQRPIGYSPCKRHHVRLWQSEEKDKHGRPLWFGSVTLDKRAGISYTTLQITHHIDSNVDAEREKLTEDLSATCKIATISWQDGFHDKLQGRNGGGDFYFTDGRLAVLEIMGDE
jgi:hypothetical protein